MAVMSYRHSKATSDMIDSSNVDSMFGTEYMKTQFQSFKAKHGKSYASPLLEAHRFQIFQQNMQKIAELSIKNPEATFGATKFADLHPLEFKQRYLTYKPAVGDAAVLRQQAPVRQATPEQIRQIPDSFDWRSPDKGRSVAVTAVKDQGQCGSCWAFSAVETVESAHILAGNTPVALAPEQVVDCDTVDGGCNGGDTPTAYAYIKANGLQTEQSYPYTAGNSGTASQCAYNKNKVVTKIAGFTYATPGCTDSCAKQDEAKLAESLYNVGPVSICVDASSFQFYSSGILTASSGCASDYNSLNHCVQLVGYGIDAASKTKFWSIRNSWAASWGEQGYVRVLYGANTCGVADEATNVEIA